MGHKKSIGLRGGPNEYITDISEFVSIEGYKRNSPDVNNPFNLIDSGSITMEGVDFPVMGTDNLGNSQMMTPGNNYQFPGDSVLEVPMAQEGAEVDYITERMDDFDGNFISPLLIPENINPFINKYVFSKYLSEQIVQYFGNSIPSIIVRLSNIYGYTKLRRPDLVPTIMQDVFIKEEVKIWNDEPKRDFIFTEDAADAVLKLIDSSFQGVINLGSGKMSSIKDMCTIISNLSKKKIISENKKVSGPMEFVTDISKIKKIIDWEPKYDIRSGLKKTYDIMKAYNQNNL